MQFEVISLEKLKSHITEAFKNKETLEELADMSFDHRFYYWFQTATMVINLDLAHIRFDRENVEVEEFNVLPNGMPYMLVYAGGDWELPVYFIIYWDGYMLRAYAPKTGNTYNLQSMTAYGSEEENPNYAGPLWGGDGGEEDIDRTAFFTEIVTLFKPR